MDDRLLMIFIAVTAVAVVIQAGILVSLYVAVRKSSAKMEALAEEIRNKAVPTMETMQTFLSETKPKIDIITANVTESSTLLKNQLVRIDAALTDALDRTRLQVIRADELVSRTMDKVEETSEAVHNTVMSPLRQLNGLMAALSTGVDVLFGPRRRGPKNGVGVPQDEMFI